MDRGRTDSAFEGDNHFRNLASPRKINKVKHVNETVDYEDNKSLRLGIRIQQSISSKYNQLNRHNMFEKEGMLKPVRGNH